MVFLNRSSLVGVTLLAAVNILPVAVPAADSCVWFGCEEIRAAVSASADFQVVGNTVYGTMTTGGNYWANLYDPSIMLCGIYGDWEVEPVYRSYPNDYVFSGISLSYDECRQVCGGQSEISKGFRLSLSPGTYEFQWKLGSCINSVFYTKILTILAESWDAPTCQTCVGDSPTACIHPYPRSLVISSRPDLTLPSPLGDRTIERTYRTGLVGDAVAGDGMFGKGWRANFEYRIGTANVGNTNGVMLFDAAGRKIFYGRSNYLSTPMAYTSPDGNGGTITSAADGSYLWKDAAGTSFQFDAAGKILSTRDIHGNQELYGYTAGRITSLTDRHGRVVTFDYQGTNHVVRLVGPSIAANPTGVYATYAYDARGNLTGVSYPDGSALNYRYENAARPNHMTRNWVSGEAGPSFQQLFQYDTQGRVQAVSEGPEGRSYQLAYGYEQVDFDPLHPEIGKKTLYHATATEWTDGNWNFQIDGDEVQTAQRTYYYENRGGAHVATKIEDGGCSCAAEKRYDSAYRVVESKDNRGVAALMTYDGRGRMTSLTEAAGTADERIAGFEYVYATSPVFPGQILQKTIRRQSVALPDEAKLVIESNDPSTGRLLARREEGFRGDGSAMASETVYSYSASGAIQSVDGPLPGPIDRITYDYHPAGNPAAGMLWKVTELNGAVTTFQQYDGLGNVLRTTDANNRDTIHAYGSRGSLQERSTVDGTTRFEYDARGNVAKTTHPKGNTVLYQYGQAGLRRIADATGWIDFGYTNGNRTSESVFNASSVLERTEAYDYDENNRLWRTRQAGGDFKEYLYDENGNRVAGKLYAASTPTVPFKTTLQGYDFLNRLTTVAVAGEAYQVSYGYDAQGHLDSVTDPIGQVTSYSYDDFGRRERVVAPETGTTEFTYDEAGNALSRRDNLNRVVSYAYDGLSRPTNISYPDETPPVSYRYDSYSDGTYPDAVGRLTEVRDASGFRRFFYTAAGRLGRIVHTIDERDFTTEHTYDPNGNLVALTYPSGRTIHYAYDPVTDRVQSVTSSMNGSTTELAAGITHKPFGPMNGLDYGNGAHLAKGYENLMHRLDSQAVTGPFGSLLPARSYEYDPAGNIHEITRNLPGGAEPHVFEYDLMDRLWNWTKPGRSQELTYDANGNRLSISADGQTTEYSYDPVARNILAGTTGAASTTFESDPLGNITGWDSTSLVYDLNGRLGRVEDGGLPLAEYVYSIDGQRARKTAGGKVTYFEYDASGRLIHEYRAGDEVAVDYVYLEGEPLAMLVSDRLTGRSIVASSAGANGAIAPSGAQSLNYNQAVAFTVTPNAGYHIGTVSGCGGALIGSTYTTAPITGDCTVAATFVINSYIVTTSAGANGDITPFGAQSINLNQTATFTVTPNAGYHIGSVSGCGGALVGSAYTTAPITGDCAVAATFVINSYIVTATAGANGYITPIGAQAVSFNQTATFTVTPNANYHIGSVSGCGGALIGSAFTTAPIAGDCAVAATFDKDCFTVTPAAGPGGSLWPGWPHCVLYDFSTSFIVTPALGYSLVSVTGCGGFLHMTDSQLNYQTGAMTADCVVTANFALRHSTVTSSYTGRGSVTPSTPVSLTYFSAASFTVTPSAGYYVASVTGCGGTLSGTTYTISAITADCTFTAIFAEDPYLLSVTKSGAGSGTVTSSPAGINCGAICSALFDPRSVVSLSQTPNAGSVFSGWIGGECSGAGNCEVNLTSPKSVHATYAQGITVTAPNGGEALKRGTTFRIVWTYLGSPGTKVKVELLKGGLVNKTIAHSAAVGVGGIGSLNWKVPNNQAVGTDYRIRVTSTTAAGYTDTSDANFTVN